MVITEKTIETMDTLIINGHPNKDSFNFALVNRYKKGLLAANYSFDEIIIHNLEFEHSLKYGYQQRVELEQDLLDAWDKINRAEKIVIFMPIWWGGMPGVMKCFFDRLFLPGLAFQYRKDSPLWDKLLIGKSAHLVVTMDTPVWYFKWVYGEAGIKQIKNNILKFCGINPVKTTYISPIKGSTLAFREKWLTKIEDLGKKK